MKLVRRKTPTKKSKSNSRIVCAMRSQCSDREKQCSAVLMYLARAGRLSTKRLSSELHELLAAPVKSNVLHMHGNALDVIWTWENVCVRNKINQPRPKYGNA